MPIEPIAHLEKSIAGTVEPVTHLEKYIAGAVEPVSHLEKVIDQYGGGGSAVLIQKTITANGTFAAADDNADGYSSVTVDVASGGGYTNDDFADTTKPVGAVTFSSATTSATGYKYLLAHRTGITEINFPNAILIPDYIVSDCTSLSTVTAPKAQTLGEFAFVGCSALQRIVFPVANRIYASAFQDCSNLIAADFGGTPASGEGFWRTQIFRGCTKLNILVIRGSAVWALAAVGVFMNSPFASGKAGGTLYVPAALISDYQAATNWSTILGYENNQIKSIESTATDPDAPVDLTTHYIDGTLIPSA